MSDLKEVCRVIVLGGHRGRVAKVASLLLRGHQQQEREAIRQLFEGRTVSIEYVPCVALFDSYEDDNGNNIRYLMSVNYFGPGGNLKKPKSLLPFFDEVDEDGCGASGDASQEENSGLGMMKGALFRGVSGVAVGMGIDDDEDIARISEFLKTMSGCSIPIERIRPNPEHSTMAEELERYKALDAEQKAEVTRLGTMGPGKMAKFATEYANELIRKAIEERESTNREEAVASKDEHDAADHDKEQKQHQEPHLIDPNRNRYYCRRCRTCLFGEADLEDPPHEPSRHRFSHRKQKNLPSTSMNNGDLCGSYFLQSGLDWMGDISAFEGKISCPKCFTKIGTWNWSGAQCSCGTWVTPAIQIPKSKVDLVLPRNVLIPTTAADPMTSTLVSTQILLPHTLQPTVPFSF